MSNRNVILLKVATWLVCLAPVAWLAYGACTNNLGANPLEEITHTTGDWTFYLLAATLAVTPLRKLTGASWLIRFRRLLGLFAFFYGTAHLMTYLWFDKFFDLHEITKDVLKRKFIFAGFTGWLLMVPLAITSTAWAIRKLGGKNWNLLHKLIYLSAIAGVVHFFWLVKSDYSDPILYGAVVAVLLGYRIFIAVQKRASVPADQKRAPAV